MEPSSSSEHRALQARLERHRPRPASSGPVLVVLTVLVVAFIGITLYVVAGGRDGGRVQRLQESWVLRHPQIPGPPAEYRENALAMLRRGDRAKAAEWAVMALALDPADVDARLVLLVAGPDAGDRALAAADARALVSAVAEAAPAHPMLAAAEARVLAAEGAPDAEIAAVLEGRPDAEAAYLRLERALAAGVLPERGLGAIFAVARHEAGCSRLIQERWNRGDLAGAEVDARACAAAGVGAAVGGRVLGEIALLRGDAPDAVRRFLAASLDLHAVAAACAAGLPIDDPRLQAALAEPVAPAAVASIWCGRAAGDEALVERGRVALDRSDGPAPEERIPRAAASVWRGDAAQAEALLGPLEGPAARLVRARARASQGDAAGALAELDRLDAVSPGLFPALRLRVSLLEAGAPGAGWAWLRGQEPASAALRRGDLDLFLPLEPLVPAAWPAAAPGGDAALRAALTGGAAEAWTGDPVASLWAAAARGEAPAAPGGDGAAARLRCVLEGRAAGPLQPTGRDPGLDAMLRLCDPAVDGAARDEGLLALALSDPGLAGLHRLRYQRGRERWDAPSP